jgi:hypothetical protein
MTAKRILALDIATNSGFAVDPPVGSANPDRPISGSFLVKHQGDRLGDAYRLFENNVEDLIIVHRPDVFSFEAPLPRGRKDGVGGAPTSAHAVRKLFGLAAIAELIATRHGLEVYESNVQSARSHILRGVGRGKEQKAAVFRFCWTLGWNPIDEDASDACAVWSYTHGVVNSALPKLGALPLFNENAKTLKGRTRWNLR